MRIIGGKYKGRTLIEFGGKEVRPTSDMTRESLFNILQFKIYGATFLDLFCGTGAIGIEAISRGATKVTFNDIDRKSIAILKQNLQKLKVEEDYAVCNYDALQMLKRGDKFDFIYIDPPYKTDLGARALEVVSECLTDNGVAILESEKPFEGEVLGLNKYDARKYGRNHLTFFLKESRV